jgi:hypothetical protein
MSGLTNEKTPARPYPTLDIPALVFFLNAITTGKENRGHNPPGEVAAPHACLSPAA